MCEPKKQAGVSSVRYTFARGFVPANHQERQCLQLSINTLAKFPEVLELQFLYMENWLL